MTTWIEYSLFKKKNPGQDPDKKAAKVRFMYIMIILLECVCVCVCV